MNHYFFVILQVLGWQVGMVSLTSYRSSWRERGEGEEGKGGAGGEGGGGGGAHPASSRMTSR